MKVFMLGASGDVGHLTARALCKRGHDVLAFVRAPASDGSRARLEALQRSGVRVRVGDPLDRASLARDGLCGERVDVFLSTMASRTGVAREAFAVDHRAHVEALHETAAAGARHAVLLSAICVQRPRLAFQHAKLAFEAELAASGLSYAIVRPTAFFKSLSGQIDRVASGRPYTMFGDGRLTACKPIAEADVAAFLADCVSDRALANRIHPVGGPGPAIMPREQGEALFRLLGRAPRMRSVPPSVLVAAARTLSVAARLAPALEAKAEYARIGHYYATQSMLVLDETTGRYDADATPSYGTRTLFEHYAARLSIAPEMARTRLQRHAP